jgi:hypothetical protein
MTGASDRVTDRGDAVAGGGPPGSAVRVFTDRCGLETVPLDGGVLLDAANGGRRLERVRTVDGTEVTE